MEQRVIDAAREVAQSHQFGPTRIAHDASTVLLVIKSEPSALQLHLASSEIEKKTGLVGTIRTWSMMSPGERTRFEEIAIWLD